MATAHKRQRLNFTLQQRHEIYQHSQANPKMKQQELAKWAKEAFGMDAEPSQSAISYAIRGHKQYEKLGEAEGKMKRPRNVKHPKLDNALAKWVKDCYAHGTRISSLMVKQKAVTFCERLNIPKSSRPSFSNGWLHAFNKRYGFRNYARHREVISDDQSMLAASSSIPRKPRGPYSIAFKRDVVRFYNFSDRDMQATLQEFFSGDKTAAALEKKRKFVIAWAREEERIEELMAYDTVSGGLGAPPSSAAANANAPSTFAQQQQPQQPLRTQPPTDVLSPAAEQVIVSWVIDMRQAGAPVSSDMLEQKARDVAADFGLSSAQFTPSWQWRQEFLKRYSYPLGGFVPPTNSYYDQSQVPQRMHAVAEEHKHQQEQHAYVNATANAMNNGSQNWRPQDNASGPYGSLASQQALLLNMRSPPSTSRFSISQEVHHGGDAQQRISMDNYHHASQAPPMGYHHQQQQAAFHPQFQTMQYQGQYQQQHYQSAHYPGQSQMPQQQPMHHMAQHQTYVSAAHQVQAPPVSASVAPQPQPPVQPPPHIEALAPAVPTPAQSDSQSNVVDSTTASLDAPSIDAAPASTVAADAAPPPLTAALSAQSAQAIIELGDQVVEARKREAHLRVEGLRYDNAIKRMKILEENILARKRLKDAGIPQDEIDKLIPQVKFD
ncbi:putative Ars binding protein 1, partial [Globisporangium splendens]